MNQSVLLPADYRCSLETDRVELRFTVAADYPFFEGHFPGRPIVPGVVQVGWALWAVERLSGGMVEKVSKFRFLKPIEPNAAISVVAQRGAKGYACQVLVGDEIVSKGTLRRGECNGV